MTKKTKKLALAKETIRIFAVPGLVDVYGGTVSGAFTTGCESRIRPCFSPPTGG